MELQADKSFTDEHRKFAKAVYMDLVQTYPQMALDMVAHRAYRLIAQKGKPVTFIDSVLIDVYKRAKLI